MKSKRIEYIDVAKGVTILLVIVGHVSHLPEPIKSSIYSFHMPLFFLLSGYFFRKEDVLVTFKRMLPTIVIPYIVVGGGNSNNMDGEKCC